MLAARRERTDGVFAARPSGAAREKRAVDMERMRAHDTRALILSKHIAVHTYEKGGEQLPLPEFQRAISDGGSDLLSNNQLLVLL